MPDVKSGENRNQFVSRCVPIVMNEGLTQDQALGKCEGIYNTHVGKRLCKKVLEKTLEMVKNGGKD